jgi:two-component system, OmpR family, heavy metal sensor histidine kinase CusS
VKLRSFRLRIVLLSAVLAGSAIAGFAFASWWLIYNAKVGRLDAKLENQLMRTMRYQEQWQAYEAILARDLETGTDTPVALWVVGRDGNTLYRSPNWSTELNASSVRNIMSQPLPLTWTPPLQQPPPTGQDFRPPLQLRQPPPPTGQDFRPPPPNFPQPKPRIITQRTKTDVWRIGAIALPGQQVAIALNLQAIDREMALVANIFLVSIPGILLLIAVGAWWLSGRALTPVHRMTTAIRQVTAEGLDRRIPTDATDVEFVKLVQVFNQMLERLERSFKQASRFSGDAAHELKTPLAILQGELEQMLQQAEPGSAMQQSLGNLLDEVSRLSGITRKLLLLSLADAGKMSLYHQEVNLSILLQEIAEDIELIAPNLEVKTSIADNIKVQGDHDLLAQVLQNLISNAIKYNLPNGWIKIQADQQQKTVFIRISNASKDIPDCDREHLFDRFYRGDRARLRQIEGVGLGLSLAREITRAHNGKLVLEPAIGGLTTFLLTLPTAS